MVMAGRPKAALRMYIRRPEKGRFSHSAGAERKHGLASPKNQPENGLMKTHNARAPVDLPEIELQLPSQACGCHTAFTAIELTSARSNPVYLRCCKCGREWTDLAALYDEPIAG
jgi:hypothetical protein